MKLIQLIFMALLVLVLANTASADSDTSDRYLKFTMTYEGTPSTGEFTDFKARASFDSDQLDTACLDVAVNTRSADIGSEDLNVELPKADWFDVAEHPRAHFFSDDIQTYSESDRFDYVAKGTLTLKGVEKMIDLPFNWNQQDNTAILSGETEVSRTDFDIGSGEWADTDAIGDTVVLEYRTRFRWQEGTEGAPCPVTAPGDPVLEPAEPDVADLPDPVPDDADDS